MTIGIMRIGSHWAPERDVGLLAGPALGKSWSQNRGGTLSKQQPTTSNAEAKEKLKMSQRYKDIATRFEEEFKNRANLDIVNELMSPDVTLHLPFPVPSSREGMKAVGQAVFGAFSHESLKLTIEHVVVDGDYVVTRDRVRAIHTGPFNGVPATNKEVTWTELNMFRIKDGKIVELWGEGNLLGLMVQIGGVPPPPKR